MSGSGPQSRSIARPTLAWTGAAVFAGGWMLALPILQGVGQHSCGTFGLNCVARAFFWLLGTQALAALLLWPGAARMAPASWGRRLALAGAVLSSLAVLCGLVFVVMVLAR